MDALLWFFVLSLGAAIATTVVMWNKRGRFPLLYGLPIGVVFFTFIAFVFSPIQQGTGIVPPHQVEKTDVADLVIQTSVDLTVLKDQSTRVSVTISRLGQFPSSSGSTPQPTVGLTPVGTPGVPIVKAFGPGYNVSAVAQLNASAFDVAPQGQQEESLDQPLLVIFTWTVAPKYTGPQVLAVTVTGRWTPKNGEPVIERPLASQFLSIDVIDTPKVEETPKPFFSFSQLDVTQLLIVLLSSGLNVPWIIELAKWTIKFAKKRQPKRRPPVGGTGGKPFEPDLGGDPSLEIAAITIWQGWYITAIQATYRDTRNRTRAIPPGNKHGGAEGGGNPVTFSFEPGRGIVGIYLTWGPNNRSSTDVIHTMTFLTDDGSILGPLGGGDDHREGEHKVSLSVDNFTTHQRIINFTGAADLFIDALGIIFK